MRDDVRCLGILSTQAYSYFKRYPLDKLLYKLLVSAISLGRVTSRSPPRSSHLDVFSSSNRLQVFGACHGDSPDPDNEKLIASHFRLLEVADQVLIAHAVYTYLVTYVHERTVMLCANPHWAAIGDDSISSSPLQCGRLL